MPDEAETTGLLALLLLHSARTGARFTTCGELVPFGDQDRARWDRGRVDEARDLVAGTGRTPPGPYQLQAAIALMHTGADAAD